MTIATLRRQLQHIWDIYKGNGTVASYGMKKEWKNVYRTLHIQKKSLLALHAVFNPSSLVFLD